MIQQEVINEARDLIAGFIVSRRKELGFTQVQLAERAGLGVRTIERIEGKKFIPNGESLLKICYALDCFFFFGEKESKDPFIKAFANRWKRPGDEN